MGGQTATTIKSQSRVHTLDIEHRKLDGEDYEISKALHRRELRSAERVEVGELSFHANAKGIAVDISHVPARDVEINGKTYSVEGQDQRDRERIQLGSEMPIKMRFTDPDGSKNLFTINIQSEERTYLHISESDMALIQSLQASKDRLFDLSRRVRDEYLHGDAEGKLYRREQEYILSIVEEVAGIALNDINTIMKAALKEKWRNLTFEDDFKPTVGKLPNGACGRYHDKKFKMSLDYVGSHILAERDSMKNLDATMEKLRKVNDYSNRFGEESAIFDLYSIVVHEAFHAVQERRLGVKSHGLRTFVKFAINNDKDDRQFAEGSAAFVENYLTAIMKTRTIDPDADSHRRFLAGALEGARANMYDVIKPDDIVSALNSMKTYQFGVFMDDTYGQGCFVFSLRYVANEDFVKTLREICIMATEKKYTKGALYEQAKRDVAAGNLEKMQVLLRNL